MTPAQIGAGVGAALTALILFSVRDLSPQGERGNLSSFLIGVLAGFGALLGMALGSLVNFLRHRKKQEGVPDVVAGEEIEAAVQAASAPESQTERSCSPILRVAAGLLALMFAGILPLMIAQGKLTWDGGVLMAVLALLFGWYAARGNRGLPQSLTKR
jgi:uncharacterized membrane protein YfcA